MNTAYPRARVGPGTKEAGSPERERRTSSGKDAIATSVRSTALIAEPRDLALELNDVPVSNSAESAPEEGGTTVTQSVVNFCNSCLGTGLLGFPHCFHDCGILLTFLLIMFISLCTHYAFHFLLSASVMTGKRTYESLAQHVLGRVGGNAVYTSVLLLQTGTLVAYLNILADTLSSVAGTVIPPGAEPSRENIMCLLILTVFLPMGLFIDKGKALAVVNIFSLSVICSFTVVMFASALVPVRHTEFTIWDSSKLMLSFPIISFGFTAHTVLFPVYNGLGGSSTDSRRMRSVLSQSIVIITGCYLTVGASGYAAFRDITAGDILRNFGSNASHSEMLHVLKIGYGTSIACTIPIILLPLRSSLLPLITGLMGDSGSVAPNSTASHLQFRVLTIIILTVVLTVAMLVPNVEFVFGLTGATACVMLAFIMPGSIYLAATCHPPPTMGTSVPQTLRRMSLDANAEAGGSPKPHPPGRGGGGSGGVGGGIDVTPNALANAAAAGMACCIDDNRNERTGVGALGKPKRNALELDRGSRGGFQFEHVIAVGLIGVGLFSGFAGIVSTFAAVQEEAEVVSLAQELVVVSSKTEALHEKAVALQEAAARLEAAQVAAATIRTAHEDFVQTQESMLSAATSFEHSGAILHNPVKTSRLATKTAATLADAATHGEAILDSVVKASAEIESLKTEIAANEKVPEAAKAKDETADAIAALGNFFGDEKPAPEEEPPGGGDVAAELPNHLQETVNATLEAIRNSAAALDKVQGHHKEKKKKESSRERKQEAELAIAGVSEMMEAMVNSTLSTSRALNLTLQSAESAVEAAKALVMKSFSESKEVVDDVVKAAANVAENKGKGKKEPLKSPFVATNTTPLLLENTSLPVFASPPPPKLDKNQDDFYAELKAPVPPGVFFYSPPPPSPTDGEAAEGKERRQEGEGAEPKDGKDVAAELLSLSAETYNETKWRGDAKDFNVTTMVKAASSLVEQVANQTASMLQAKVATVKPKVLSRAEEIAALLGKTPAVETPLEVPPPSARVPPPGEASNQTHLVAGEESGEEIESIDVLGNGPIDHKHDYQ